MTNIYPELDKYGRYLQISGADLHLHNIYELFRRMRCNASWNSIGRFIIILQQHYKKEFFLSVIQ